jgi:hypothetical protein
VCGLAKDSNAGGGGDEEARAVGAEGEAAVEIIGGDIFADRKLGDLRNVIGVGNVKASE